MKNLNSYKLIGLMGLSFWVGYTLSPLSHKNYTLNPVSSGLGFSYQMGQPQLTPKNSTSSIPASLASGATPGNALNPHGTITPPIVDPIKKPAKAGQANPNKPKVTPTVTQNQTKPRQQPQPSSAFSQSHQIGQGSKLSNPLHSQELGSPLILNNNANNSVAAQALGPSAPSKTQESRTDTEWRNYLGPQPNRVKLDSFYQGLQAGQVSETFYFTLIQEYLQTKQDPSVQAAFYLLSLNPSATAFEVLFETKASYPTEAERLISKYNTSKSLPGLVQILNRSNNEELVTFTLQHTLLITSKEKFFDSPTANSNETRPKNTNKWAYLIKSLEQLQKEESSTNSLLASQVLQQMETGVQLATTEKDLL
jgi:hypothetical protein